jgi:hypothetical protein
LLTKSCIFGMLLKIEDAPCSFTIELPVIRTRPPPQQPEQRCRGFCVPFRPRRSGSVRWSVPCCCSVTGLDVFRHGYGSRELFRTLGRHLLIVVFGEQLGHTSLTTFREPSLQCPKGCGVRAEPPSRFWRQLDYVYGHASARLRLESK